MIAALVSSPSSSHLTSSPLPIPRPLIERASECFDKALAETIQFTNQEKDLLEDCVNLNAFQDPRILSCSCVLSKDSIPKTILCPKKHEFDREKTQSCSLLNKHIEKEKRNLIVNCEECVREDLVRATRFLKAARECVETARSWLKGKEKVTAEDQKEAAAEYEAALENYRSAFRLTKSPTAYQEVVDLYREMGLNDRAGCATLYLALLTLRAGDIPNAILTLEGYVASTTGDLRLEIQSIAVSLQYISGRLSSGEVLEKAQALPDEEAKGLYREIITREPTYAPAYFALAEKTTKLQEKRAILLQGKTACDPSLAAQFDEQIALSNISPRAISVEELGSIEAVKARVPWPEELTQFWDALSEEEKNQYVVFPIPTRLVLDGEEVPYTYRNIEKLAKAKDQGCPGIKFIWPDAEAAESPPEEGEIVWAVMTKTVLEGSRNLTYAQQDTLIGEWRGQMAGESLERQGFLKFAMPTARDVLFMLLWHWEASGQERLYSDNPWTYTRCLDAVRNIRLVVGGFAPGGVAVSHDYDDAIELIGVGALGKFFRT